MTAPNYYVCARCRERKTSTQMWYADGRVRTICAACRTEQRIGWRVEARFQRADSVKPRKGAP